MRIDWLLTLLHTSETEKQSGRSTSNRQGGDEFRFPQKGWRRRPPRDATDAKAAITARSTAAAAALGALFILLAIELFTLIDRPGWAMPDYYMLLNWGRAARAGSYYFLYPAPVLFWIAVPLSLLPSWFALVWLAAPFVVLLFKFRKNGFLIWLFFPTILQAASGQIDGWLVLPLWWIFADLPLLGPISCALLTLKPQLAFLVVPFTLLEWLAGRRWKSALQFLAAMAILYVPTFLVAPIWPWQMVAAMQTRAGESLLPTRGASLWWWPRDTSWEILGELLVIAVVAALFMRAVRRKEVRRQAVFVLSLLFMPVLYAVSYVTVAAAVRNSARELIAVVLASWIAVLIDVVAVGWGGAYALIPIVALVCLAELGPPDTGVTRRREPGPLSAVELT